jgi:hypothetical protein
MANETKEKITGGEGLDERSVTSEMSLISIPERGLSIEKELAGIERNIELFNKIKVLALRLTKPSDWVDMGGNPYLLDRGASSVAVAFGIDISEVRVTKEWADDPRGRYYTFIASGKAYARKLGRYVEDIGVCSQRDKFFGKIGDKFKEIEDVDMTNIIRKAVTNLEGRLTKRVIGIGGVTWEDLAQAGIPREKIGKVEYKSGAQKTDLSPEGKDAKAKLGNTLLMMANNDKAQAVKLLEKYSFWIDGEKKEHKASDINKMSERWINSTYGKAKADYEKTSGGPREPGAEG